MSRAILVVGGGAREHALCWRLAGEPGVGRVLAAPGNPLMDDVAEVHPDVAAGDAAAVVDLARRERVDLVVVGPEAPLVDGFADALRAAGVPCFGPGAAAATLEGSKSFARDVCRAAGVPMADGRAFGSVGEALAHAEVLAAEGAVVVKADGLAAGKGVSICTTFVDAEAAIRGAMEAGRFGAAGRRIVVERFLEGVEASVIAICDRSMALVLPAARDHKRLRDGDEGPNTGGMGAYSPIAELDDGELRALAGAIHLPVLAEMERRGTPFRGALFCGLMLTADGRRVLEFNVRFGDPETQAVLPRLAVPLGPLLAAAAEDRLVEAAAASGIVGPLLPILPGATVAVTLAVAGYPEAPRIRDPIIGVDEARAAGGLIFGAGVGRAADTELVTAGGRVLTVVGRGVDVSEAADSAYAAADRISFAGRQLRRDIGRAPMAAGVAESVA